MEATVSDRLSIQVTEIQHYALQRTTAALVYAGTSLGHVHTAHACTSAVAKGIAHVSVKAAVRAGAKTVSKVGAKAGAYGAADSAETLFQLGFQAAISGTALGIVGGVALAVNTALEGPLLARSVYKLYRKKKFDQLSQHEFDQSVLQEMITSANTVFWAVGGALAGQAAIPVPILGAAVGGAVGGLIGQACGRGEGWVAGKLFVGEPRHVAILPLVRLSFIDNPPLDQS